MGIPLYKPKECRESIIRSQAEQHELWNSPPSQIIQDINDNSRRRTLTNPFHISPITLSLPVHHREPTQLENLRSRLRSRTSRGYNLLTSSYMDRRRNARVHPIHGVQSSIIPTSRSSARSSSNTTQLRNELDRRLSRLVAEKGELYEQLRVTVSLLDQFLIAREVLGSGRTTLPSFITEDLPAVLASASSLAAMAPSSSASASGSNSGEEATLQRLVERCLRTPPYSTRIYHLENSIVSSQRRIREQLSLLGSEVTFPSPPSPQLPSPPSDNHNHSDTFEDIFESRPIHPRPILAELLSSELPSPPLPGAAHTPHSITPDDSDPSITIEQVLNLNSRSLASSRASSDSATNIFD